LYKEILNDEVVSEKIGLVAGSGDLPAEIIEFCDKHKVEVYCALLKSFAKTENFTNRHTAEFHIGHIGKIIKYFKKNKITKLVFAGGVKKPSIFSLGCDFTGFLLLKQIFKNKVFGDNTTLETIIKFVEKKGFIVGSVHDYVENSKFICGFNGKTSFNDNKFFDDIELGKQILGSLSSLDLDKLSSSNRGML
jgi:DUF1009 family protein